jgi:hypothetical protein
MEGPHSRSRRVREQANLLLLQGIERVLICAARSRVIIPTELSRLRYARMDNTYELNFAISATECMYTNAEGVNCFNIYPQQVWKTATMEAAHP